MFKRIMTTFQGGEVTGLSFAGLTRGCHVNLGEQLVKIIRPVIAGDDDEEDKFEVEFFNLGRTIVDGCDLHPHPNAPATNAEFMAWLVESASPNPLMQGFVPEAVAKYAEFCLQDGGERYRKQAGDNPLVNPTAWLGVAQEALDAINKNYRGR